MGRNLWLAAVVSAAMALGNFLAADDANSALERSYFQAISAFVTAFAVYRPSRNVPGVRWTLDRLEEAEREADRE